MAIIPLWYGLKHLVWNSEHNKVYVACPGRHGLANIGTFRYAIGFKETIAMGDNHTWRNLAFLQWALAELPGVP